MVRNPVAGSDRKKPTVGVITVTHNSGRFLGHYLRALEDQSIIPDRVVIVDSGSDDVSYLNAAAESRLPLDVIRTSNVGFSKGNNLAWERVRSLDYTLLLNPDAFLAPDFFAIALNYMQANATVGMITPSLIRYDIATQQSLGLVDTTGVVRGRLGYPVERDAGAPVEALEKYKEPNPVPWVCAAAALARREALMSVLECGELFDESLFMYKEDVDLSWRIRRAGWLNMHHPGLKGFHCRGWQDRNTMSRSARLHSARNEMRICAKHHSPFLVVGALKYLAVSLFDV